MDEAHPYRAVAAPEVLIAWTTEADALAGMRTLIDHLRQAGLTLDDLVLEVTLRPYFLAFVDAEPETAVYVAWEIARQVNRLLEQAGNEIRLHRAGETSPRFLLLSPTDAAARRAAGEVLFVEPPPIGPIMPVLVRMLGALCALIAVVGALVWVGAYVELALTVGAFVITSVIARVIAKRERPWKYARFLPDAPFAIPLGVLLYRGELVALGIVVVALAIAAIAQRWRT